MIRILVGYEIGRIVARLGARELDQIGVQDSMFSGLVPAMVTPFDERERWICERPKPWSNAL